MNVKLLNTTIEVSILCTAYNHENYIRDTLNGFVMQKTNFNYEVLIHDDASIDNTALIIKEYEEKYPHIIKPIYQVENQYSKGISILLSILEPKVKGKYIAICEGDDYWTDPYKLQKQYDILEQHPELDVCAHSAWDMDKVGGKKEYIVSTVDKIFSPQEVILGGGGFVRTNTLMYRTSLNENIPDFRKKMMFDYTLQIHASLRGGMFYLHEVMSVYRTQVLGSWSERMQKKPQAYIEHQHNALGMLKFLNENTQYKYQSEVTEVAIGYLLSLATLEKDYLWIKSQEWYKDTNLRTKIKIYLDCKYPKLYNCFIKSYLLIKRIGKKR